MLKMNHELTAKWHELDKVRVGLKDVVVFRPDLRVADGYIQYSTDSGSTWQNLIALAELKGADGSNGDPGIAGQDGHSPVVTATKSGKTTTISVDGTAIATVEDGADGGSVPKPLTYDYMPEGYPSKSVSFNVEWDGNTEGLTAHGGWYKVSDLVVDPSVFASGATLTYADGSTDFMSIDDASKKYRITIEPGKVIFGEGQVMIFTETPAPPYEAFEIGVYFQSGEIYDVRKVTGGEVITPMAEEFLPNIPADKLPSGGGSADAVLYTAQTLTDAQKQQARENIDAAIADFVVNGNLNSNMEVTLDKTFAQIQSAVQEGKQPVVKISESGVSPTFVPMVSASQTKVVFAAVTNIRNGATQFISVVIKSSGDVRLDMSATPAINSDGAVHQFPMDSDPTSPMQVATKQYVDDALAAIVDGTEVSY